MNEIAVKRFDMRNLYYYQMGNDYKGSIKGFNYKVEPVDDKFRVTIWHGMLSSDVAEPEIENEFSFDDEGFEKMLDWLEETYQKDIAG